MIPYQGGDLPEGTQGKHPLQRGLFLGPWQEPPDEEELLSEGEEEDPFLHRPAKVEEVDVLEDQRPFYPFLLHPLTEPFDPVPYLLAGNS
ncbi:MAG: hypothetical protein DRG32_02075 [Deltaproteobacteria bacterium]|nr:MAG: hypothetical protein DRG32_02075 [Deltaproteobacteria bacterium]